MVCMVQEKREGGREGGERERERRERCSLPGDLAQGAGEESSQYLTSRFAFWLLT